MVKIVEENFTGPEYVKKFAKHMLKNTIFMGTFHEQRFVDSLKAYRDIVCIFEDEKEFIANLMAVKKRIESEFGNIPWIGITSPDSIGTPAGYNVWVELPVQVFGTYWFKIKTVKFCDDNICLKLDVIKSIRQNYICGNSSISTDPTNDSSFNISVANIQIWCKKQLSYLFNNELNLQNIKTTIIFIAIFLSTLFLGAVDVIKYLLEFFLRFLNEFSKLMHSLSPIFINLINLCGRTISGFFQLIAVLIKRNPRPQPVYNAYVNYDPATGMPGAFNFSENFPRSLPSNQNRSRIRQIRF